MIVLFTIVFLLVDDWYKSEGIKLLRGKAGAKPEFTDSEMITLMLVPRPTKAGIPVPMR
jgi:hypothetical protein